MAIINSWFFFLFLLAELFLFFCLAVFALFWKLLDRAHLMQQYAAPALLAAARSGALGDRR